MILDIRSPHMEPMPSEAGRGGLYRDQYFRNKPTSCP